VSHILELVDEADKNKDGKIDYNEWQVMGASPQFTYSLHLC
jgi:EF hand